MQSHLTERQKVLIPRFAKMSSYLEEITFFSEHKLSGHRFLHHPARETQQGVEKVRLGGMQRAEKGAGAFLGIMAMRRWWCCSEVRVGCSHRLKLSFSICHSLNSVRNMQQPRHIVNMQEKWYRSPYKESVSLPKQFPDTILPKKRPFISVLMGADEECTTLK